MSNDLAKLYEVQQIDTRIHELEREREALDSGAELQTQVEALRTQVHTARDELRALEAELRDTELKIKTHEAKKKNFEDKMYSGRVRNPKELEDMQREVAMLGGQIDKAEDKGLELMEETEKRRAALSEQDAALAERERNLAQVVSRYDSENSRIAEQISALEAQRASVAATVPADLLRRYEELRSKRSNLAIVKLTSEVCPGCRIAISLDTMRQLKRGERTIFCESCGRILYWEEPQATT